MYNAAQHSKAGWTLAYCCDVMLTQWFHLLHSDTATYQAAGCGRKPGPSCLVSTTNLHCHVVVQSVELLHGTVALALETIHYIALCLITHMHVPWV